MFFRKNKIPLQSHIKIMDLNDKYVLINTAFMDLRYQSSEMKFRRGRMEWTTLEKGVVRIYQSVCPDHRNKDYILAVDYKRDRQDTRFITLDEAIALIVEYEEPYKAQRIIKELCGRKIPLF